MTPAGLSIITTTYPEGPQRNKALLVYAGTAAGGFSLGMVTGGLLTTIDWRWVFFAPVLVSAAILAAAIVLIPRDAQRPEIRSGFALAYGPLTIAATDRVAEDEQGLAGGVLTISFQFGGALGLAVVAAVLAAADELTTDAFRNGLLVPLVAAGIGVAVAVGGLRTPVRDQMAAQG